MCKELELLTKTTEGEHPIGRFRGVPDRNKRESHAVNGAITAPSVRVIDAEGNQLGVMNTRDAVRRAREEELDLVEISPNATPPVCKIIDYGKFKFQEQKRAAEAKKNQQVTTVKELTIRPRTDEHDYQIKLRKAREFLLEGHKVKFNMRFRGREVTHLEIGQEMMNRIRADLDNISKVDFQSGLEGRFMSLIVSPEKTKIEAYLKANPVQPKSTTVESVENESDTND